MTHIPSEPLYNEWRDLFFQNIEPSFLSAKIADWCDDQFHEWLGAYYNQEKRPSGSEIVQFAWEINAELAEAEVCALSMAKGD